MPAFYLILVFFTLLVAHLHLVIIFGNCKCATRRVKKLRLDKKRAWLKYVNSGTATKLYEIYKEKLRKSVKENNNAKIGSKQRSKVRVGPLKDSAGNIVSDSGAIVPYCFPER